MSPEVQQLLESLTGPAWLSDPSGQVIYANSAARGYAVYPPIHPEDAARLENCWEQVAQTTTPLNLLLRLGQDGHYSRFDCRLSLLGPNRLLLGSEVESREALEERYSRLEAAEMGDWELDLSTQSAKHSLRHDQIFGYPNGVEEWSLQRFLEHVHPDDLEYVKASFDYALRQQKNWDFECRIQAADGVERWIWARGSHILAESGESLALAGLVQDITERRQSQEALRRSEQRFRSLIEASAQVVWVTDASGAMALPQPSWGNFTGQTYKEYCGWGWLEAIHPDYREQVEAHWRNCLSNHNIYEIEYLLRRHDGQYRYTQARGIPILDDSAEVKEWVGFNSDITERNLAEKALRESEARYRDLAEAQKRFVSDASHELRAPLTVIQGNLELLQRFRMKKADRDAAIAESAREATRLGRLVGDLLSLARGDAGLQLKLKQVQLDKILLEAFEQSQQLSKTHRFELGPLESLLVQGEADWLKQLAIILLDNALKYTPEGGMIRLELHREDNQAVFRVRDSGIGIAPEDLPHVFERFYRADGSRSQRSGGSGLGLSIARWIIEQHSGTIGLESQRGGGTTAIVRLPMN